MNKDAAKKVSLWLITGLILVGLMVVIGGITRLTDSGLSMVDWKLIKGAIPPINEVEWNEAFNKYKKFPEYQKINKGMTLSEFKFIFFWEYIHRLLGRIIGIVFIIPFVYFWRKKYFNPKQKKQLTILLLLGSLQAFLGWFMVKSGLVDVPDVSHYRLALHLVVAFAIMCYIYWIIINLNNIKKETNKMIFTLSRMLIICLIIQVIYGAFTAGLKAGYIIPHNSNLLNTIFGYNIRGLNDFNILTNGIDIQAVHRLLAWFIFGIVIYIFKKTRNTNLSYNGLVILIITTIQIFLGITTLLSRVNIYSAVIHQLFAILLLLTAIHINYLSSKKTQ